MYFQLCSLVPVPIIKMTTYLFIRKLTVFGIQYFFVFYMTAFSSVFFFNLAVCMLFFKVWICYLFNKTTSPFTDINSSILFILFRILSIFFPFLFLGQHHSTSSANWEGPRAALFRRFSDYWSYFSCRKHPSCQLSSQVLSTKEVSYVECYTLCNILNLFNVCASCISSCDKPLFINSWSLAPREFNSYGARRGNDAVMTRGTFANMKLQNKLVGKTGPKTIHFPSGQMVGMHLVFLLV